MNSEVYLKNQVSSAEHNNFGSFINLYIKINENSIH
jgi:hypothetical protein